MAGDSPFVAVRTADQVLSDIQQNVKDTFAQLEPTRRGLVAFSPVVKAGSYTIGEETFVVYTGPGGDVFTLPKANALTGKSRLVVVMNNGNGALTVKPSGADTIGTLSSIALNAGTATALANDGLATWGVAGGGAGGFNLTLDPAGASIVTAEDPGRPMVIAVHEVVDFEASAATGNSASVRQLAYTINNHGHAGTAVFGLRIVATETDMTGIGPNHEPFEVRVNGNRQFYVQAGTSPLVKVGPALVCGGSVTLQNGTVALTAAAGVQFGAAGQKIAFLGATPIAQQAAIASPTGGATIDAESRTAIDALRTLVQSLGFTL